jgi:hypothetical protein
VTSGNGEILMASQALAVGENLTLPELHDLVCEDADLTEDQEKDVIKELEVNHQLKKTGMRISNRAAAQDVHAMMERINGEVSLAFVPQSTTDVSLLKLDSLADRTGIYAITLMTRGHVEDPIKGGWFATGDGEAFIREVLKMDPWDLTRKLEMWACTRQKSEYPTQSFFHRHVYIELSDAIERETLVGLRAECASLINSGLSEDSASVAVMYSPVTCLESITHLQRVTMNYVNYEAAVVKTYKVKLVGWTFKKFISPANINTLHDIRALRDALKNGGCHWVPLSPQELKEHVAHVDERRESGEVVGRKRKERSDKGIPRKKRRVVNDENNPSSTSQPTTKKGKTQRLAKSIPPKSKAFIDDDDDDESSAEDLHVAVLM